MVGVFGSMVWGSGFRFMTWVGQGEGKAFPCLGSQLEFQSFGDLTSPLLHRFLLACAMYHAWVSLNVTRQ